MTSADPSHGDDHHGLPGLLGSSDGLQQLQFAIRLERGGSTSLVDGKKKRQVQKYLMCSKVGGLSNGGFFVIFPLSGTCSVALSPFPGVWKWRIYLKKCSVYGAYP